MQEKIYLKVVLLGRVSSGKTSLVTRYITNTFNEAVLSTVGAAFCRKDIVVEGLNLSLAIWDTAGAERYEAMSAMYYRNAKAAIVCFDLTENVSFQKASFWVGQLKQSENECRIYLCGTKKDLIEDDPSCRNVTAEEIQSLAQGIDADVFETSSKSGDNVDTIFQKISMDFMKDAHLLPNKKTDGIKLQEGSKAEKKSCCR